MAKEKQELGFVPGNETWTNAPREHQALAWLAAFASIGCNPQEPRGYKTSLLQSRALGLHETERDLAFDPKRHYTSEPYPDISNTNLITQEYRGYAKHWLELEDGTKVPWWADVDDNPTPERLKAQAEFLEQWSPLPEMPMSAEDRRILAAGDDLPWKLKPGPEDVPQYCPSGAHQNKHTCYVCRYIGFMDTRHLARDALSRIPAITQSILETIHNTCVRDDLFSPALSELPEGSSPPQPPAGMRWIRLEEASVALVCLNVWRWRAPVWSSFDGSKTLWVADSYPGIVWAEVLNVLLPPVDALKLLACCRWCGRFWLAPQQRGQGRPREFCCDECRIRYNDYGPADRRKP